MIIAYHGTLSGTGIRRFNEYTHFGSEAAARQRITDALALDPAARPIGMQMSHPEPALYRVRLTIRNPARISDGLLDSEDEARDMLARGYVDADGAKRIADGEEDMADILARLGYDAMVYENAHEDQGSLSYVLFDPSRITILDVQALEPESPKDAPPPSLRR